MRPFPPPGLPPCILGVSANPGAFSIFPWAGSPESFSSTSHPPLGYKLRQDTSSPVSLIPSSLPRFLKKWDLRTRWEAAGRFHWVTNPLDLSPTRRGWEGHRDPPAEERGLGRRLWSSVVGPGTGPCSRDRRSARGRQAVATASREPRPAAWARGVTRKRSGSGSGVSAGRMAADTQVRRVAAGPMRSAAGRG